MNVVQPDRMRAPGSLPKFEIEAQTLSTQVRTTRNCRQPLHIMTVEVSMIDLHTRFKTGSTVICVLSKSVFNECMVL